MVAIHLAKSAGMCFGVKGAVDKALAENARNGRNVYMLGHIVHNESVVEMIEKAGIRTVDSIDEVPRGATILIRAHGAPPSVYARARKRGLKIVDATCPLVTEIHEAVRALAAEKRRIVIIGDQSHDEVIGIAEQVKGSLVVATPEEAGQLKQINRVGVVTQSTQRMENVVAVLAVIASKTHDLRFINTICAPTFTHQADIRRLPLDNDVVVIIGSFTSANTCRMTTIAKELNPRSHQVQDASELRPEWFAGAATVGVTAGASTPDWTIRDVVARIREICQG